MYTIKAFEANQSKDTLLKGNSNVDVYVGVDDDKGQAAKKKSTNVFFC